MNQMNKRAKQRLRSKSQENHFLKNKSAFYSVADEYVFKTKGVNQPLPKKGNLMHAPVEEKALKQYKKEQNISGDF